MPFAVTFPDGYGYVVFVALGLTPLLAWVQGSVVGPLRKAAGVPYPNMYATPQQVKESRDAYKFNCAQRAHGNLLENMPQTMLYMLFAGLEYPKATFAVGTAWLICRAIFAYGYITSEKPDGKGRLYGSGYLLMQGALWGMCGALALKML
ncbi:glutathione S-transferase [Capronia coronata CBS 617.96]|uniref:Glutathione S-transferase n=1 Tax=Capronia coronata CBS 617.96 TaxID=1182541 RepID=W9ZLX0_9EURO|nr:glutathione S-transferase [Capronia coronata CBS 617.96]EXJ95484.1 glutathione S-transferase [Capronia coronata CBS 617.96]